MVRARVTKALNPHSRRKLSLRQIAAGFGGKRRQSALKPKRRSSAKKHRHAAPKAASNPKRKKANAKKRRRSTAKRRNATPKVVYRTRTKVVTKRVYVKRKRKASVNAKRRKSSNPGHYLLTMSPVGNPTVRKKRRKTTMAKQRRKASARSRSGKKRNPTRRSVRRRSIRRHRSISRNPFGLTSSAVVKKGFGVFAGFSAAKKVPPMLGPTANSSPMMSLLSTAAVAALATWLANRFIPGPIAEGVMLGGVAGVVNVAWNAWAPSQVSGYFGVGDIVPGSFPLPQGPVRMISGAGMDPSAINQAPVNTGAFGSAW